VSKTCWCATCRPVVFGDMRMVLCPECGNKRCPRATDHRNACSGSNELGQAGSAYTAHLTPQRIINGAIMTNEELDAIANREAHCKTFGAAVTLSVGERDALVAMARDGMRYRFIRDVPWLGSRLWDVIAMQQNAIWDETIDAAMAKEQA
jgi:hypothetical protein